MSNTISFLSGRKEARFIRAVCGNVSKGNWSLLSHTGVTNLFTTTNVTQILLKLSADTTLSWSFYNWAHSLPHYRHSLEPNWTMVHLLTKDGQFMRAHGLLEKFALKSLLSSPLVLGPLLNKFPSTNSQVLCWLVMYYSRSSYKDALEVFYVMKSAKIRPDLHACSALLSSLAKEVLSDTAWKVFDDKRQLGVVPNTYIYNSMLHVYFMSGKADSAQRLVTEMDAKQVQLSIISYNILIALYSKKGLHYEALCLQERMKKEGITPDIVTYNSLILGYCKEGRIREALRLFEETKRFGLKPTQVTYTTLIDGYCCANDPDTAIRLMREMESKGGIKPGVVTYNAVIRKLCELQKMKGVNDMLNEMDERGLNPDSWTCNTLINAYCKRGEMGMAFKVRERMVESGLRLDAFTYMAFVNGFCKTRQLDQAREQLFEMTHAGFKPNYSTWSWLVDGYCTQNNPGAVLMIPDELAKGGRVDCKPLYRAFIRRLCKNGFVDHAQKLLGQMLVKGLPGDGLVYTVLAFAYLREGQTSAAIETLNEMVVKNLEISRKIYVSVTSSYENETDLLMCLWAHASKKGLISKRVCRIIQNLQKNQATL
ncbi:Pentatricopeptide repeat-containing protein [Rhynchospora pubera]|uniref:Pentatricopeptide repeat-containing protein n=1 Tax=Rhynchospora pubera TaxID=906938 RepID=A0AAV8GL77_9POAL|nr:Pentatricopeptide repeat-containing protein [Rhynchospora pubera]